MLVNQPCVRHNEVFHQLFTSLLLQKQLSEVDFQFQSFPHAFSFENFNVYLFFSLLICFPIGAAHCLGVAASWIVQVGVDIYKTLFRLFNSKEDIEEVKKAEEIQLLVGKIYAVTLKCSASLVFAAIGAGLGASCIHASYGQWIGKNFYQRCPLLMSFV